MDPGRCTVRTAVRPYRSPLVVNPRRISGRVTRAGTEPGPYLFGRPWMQEAQERATMAGTEAGRYEGV